MLCLIKLWGFLKVLAMIPKITERGKIEANVRVTFFKDAMQV